MLIWTARIDSSGGLQASRPFLEKGWKLEADKPDGGGPPAITQAHFGPHGHGGVFYQIGFVPVIANSDDFKPVRSREAQLSGTFCGLIRRAPPEEGLARRLILRYNSG